MKTPRLTQTEKNAIRLCADILKDSPDKTCISVEWKPSRTWGETAGVYYRGARCSLATGCGYDKLSAALADALRWLFPHGTDAHRAIACTQGTGEAPTIRTLAAHGFTLTPVFQNKDTNAYTIAKTAQPASPFKSGHTGKGQVMNPNLEPVHNADIRWLVSQMHVGTPLREVLRDIRNRLNTGASFAKTRTERRNHRRYAYAAAITAHTENRALYRDVMDATLDNPEPRPRYYFNRTTKETQIIP